MVTTPEDFAAQMKNLSDRYGDDKEVVHSLMDDLMTQVLAELGYGEGIAIFDSQGKWYA